VVLVVEATLNAAFDAAYAQARGGTGLGGGVQPVSAEELLIQFGGEFVVAAEFELELNKRVCWGPGQA